MGENIGAAARVAKNFGITDLRVVAPRDGWPNPKARDMASDALDVVDNAMVADTLQEAAKDLNALYALTVRPRDMEKPVFTPKQLVQTDLPEAIGLVFGPERSGLSNEDISLCDAIVTVPVSEIYPSMNLAQAVAVLAYEVSQLEGGDIIAKENPKASKEEVFGFLEHLEAALDEKGFFKEQKMKPTMINNLRNIFTRHDLNEQEVRTLRGVISSLTRK